MLNAFRHLRILHLCPFVDLGRVNVLNAFRHLRILHEFIRRRGNSVRSAQRLSASSNSSHLRRFEGVATGNVLNAFRHLRILHWLPPCSMGFSPCAQRLSASSNSSQGWNVITYGGRMMCSTPFGIFEFFTCSHSREARRDTCAQRLSASSNSSLSGVVTRFGQLSCAQRLSASSNSSPGVTWSSGDSASSAQRLSASSNSSPHPPYPPVATAVTYGGFTHVEVNQNVTPNTGLPLAVLDVVLCSIYEVFAHFCENHGPLFRSSRCNSLPRLIFSLHLHVVRIHHATIHVLQRIRNVGGGAAQLDWSPVE